MLRFVRQGKLEQLLREQLAERDRVVMLLVEQIEYLRAQLGAPTVTVSRAATGDTPAPIFDAIPEGMTLSAVNSLSDEEEEIEAMRQAGVISEDEYQQALERLHSRTAADIIE